ncbi:arginase family protein [Enterobacter hormaechei]|nr:arginase family protein [Enterobacter hormaechei]
MNDRHNGDMGVLWIDSHPDVKTPVDFTNGHTMVLGNLLGGGDPEFASKVKTPVKPSRVMYAGLIEEGLTEQETAFINALGLRIARPGELYENSDKITSWIKEQNIRKLAVHLDLDVLNPDVFRSLLFAEPEPEFDWQAVYPVGKLNLAQTLRIIRDVSAETEIVIIGITEHLPWDAWNLKEFLKKIPIMNE